ncbi:MAG: hypothetical protein RLZZ218_785, partial [Actinomycetota bacterium]
MPKAIGLRFDFEQDRKSTDTGGISKHSTGSVCHAVTWWTRDC